MSKKRKQIGIVGVDSGQILICDPCYIDSEWNKGTFNYHECCNLTLADDKNGQLFYKMGHAGVGVVNGNFGGDGAYPVIATFNESNRVVKLEILFK